MSAISLYYTNAIRQNTYVDERETVKHLSSMRTDITIQELEILCDLPKHSSLRSLARARYIEPSRISKIVKSLEDKLNSQLIVRSPTGVVPTEDALELGEKVTDLLKTIYELKKPKTKENAEQTILTITSTGFLNTFIAQNLVKEISNEFPTTKLRFIDSSPSESVELTSKHLVDALVCFDKKFKSPKVYQKIQLGKMQWFLYCRKGHPASSARTLEEISQYSIIRPTYWDQVKIVEGDDGLAIKENQKIYGHQCNNTFTALSIIENSNDLVYLPSAAVSPPAFKNVITKLNIKESETKNQPVFLYLHKDRVKNKTATFLSKKLNEIFNPSLLI
jgi:DNA-binding transcriptional LysR family regulator